jgi:hypothetical protein
MWQAKYNLIACLSHYYITLLFYKSHVKLVMFANARAKVDAMLNEHVLECIEDSEADGSSPSWRG